MKVQNMVIKLDMLLKFDVPMIVTTLENEFLIFIIINGIGQVKFRLSTRV